YEGEEDEDEDLGTIRVIDEPIVIINASQAKMIGFTPTEDMYFKISPDGLTLLPGAAVDHGCTQTGPITIRLDEE
ncbi:MAG: hypothetical protein PHD21_07065, partial [Flavobacteriales bacterium]|nr:hypothetical protein [Flavobacteriales bacterium]